MLRPIRARQAAPLHSEITTNSITIFRVLDPADETGSGKKEQINHDDGGAGWKIGHYGDNDTDDYRTAPLQRCQKDTGLETARQLQGSSSGDYQERRNKHNADQLHRQNYRQRSQQYQNRIYERGADSGHHGKFSTE